MKQRIKAVICIGALMATSVVGGEPSVKEQRDAILWDVTLRKEAGGTSFTLSHAAIHNQWNRGLDRTPRMRFSNCQEGDSRRKGPPYAPYTTWPNRLGFGIPLDWIRRVECVDYKPGTWGLFVVEYETPLGVQRLTGQLETSLHGTRPVAGVTAKQTVNSYDTQLLVRKGGSSVTNAIPLPPPVVVTVTTRAGARLEASSVFQLVHRTSEGGTPIDVILPDGTQGTATRSRKQLPPELSSALRTSGAMKLSIPFTRLTKVMIAPSKFSDGSGTAGTFVTKQGETVSFEGLSWSGGNIGFCGLLPDGRTWEIDNSELHSLEFHAKKAQKDTYPKIQTQKGIGQSPVPGSATELLPAFEAELQGNNPVRIRNPNDFSVLAGLRSGGKGKNLEVPAGGTATAHVLDGKYEIFFVYSNKPDALFQGDDFTLQGNGVEIQIVKVVGGNYGIKEVK